MNNREFGEDMRKKFPNTPPVGAVEIVDPAEPGREWDGVKLHNFWTIGWKGWAHRSKWGDFLRFEGERPNNADYLRGVRDAVYLMGRQHIDGVIRYEEREDMSSVKKEEL